MSRWTNWFRRDKPKADSQPRRRRRQPTGGLQRFEYGLKGLEIVNKAIGYQSVQTMRESGRALGMHGGSGDFHLRDDVEEMRGISQKLYRTNPIYRAVIHRIWDFILGSGTILQPQTRSQKVNKYLVDAWRDFWRSPELRGWHSGPAVEWLMGTQFTRDGDIGLFKHEKSGKIQLVSADRIGSLRRQADNGNRIESGVELTRSGTIAAFHVRDYDQTGYIRQDSRRVRSRYMHILANREDSDQTRGVVMLQVNFPMFHRISDVCDSEAAAWQLLSRLAIAVTGPNAEERAGTMSETKDDPADNEIAQCIQEVTDVAIAFHADAETDIKGIDRNIPGSHFTDTAKMFLRLLGMATGLPLEFLLLIWSDTNYSSGRAAKIQMSRTCLPLWQLFCRDGMDPTYAWKVGRWLRKGKVPERSDIFEHAWHTVPYPSMDPPKEAQAALLRFRTGTTAPSIEVAESGNAGSLDQLLDMQEQDLEKIWERVDRFNKKHETDLTIADWTGFVSQKKGTTSAVS